MVKIDDSPNRMKPISSSTSGVPPHAYFVGSAIFHYLGPAFAVLLFAHVGVAGVAWLRIVSAGVIFGLWKRPWRVLFEASRESLMIVAALGVVLAIMNLSFYEAIDRLPLGTVAAIEFVGPIALAVSGARTRRNAVALVAAVAGVYLLTEVRIVTSAVGFAFAFLNAGLFTLYIVLAHRLARGSGRSTPVERLGASMLLASVVITPFGLGEAVSALVDPVLLLAGLGVGITSSVIPYVFDQLAMARLPRATYALFVALLPATAVVVGAIVLSQVPEPVEVVAVLLVIVGVLIHRPTPEEGRASASGPERG